MKSSPLKPPARVSIVPASSCTCPSLNSSIASVELARCEYITARENIIALGNSGTGKTHACLALGLAA
jgi:hypothetical protein